MNILLNLEQGPWGKKPGNTGNIGANKGEFFFNKTKDSFRKFTNNNHKIGDFHPNLPVLLLLAAIFVIWLLSGFYTVDAKEEAVITRFGGYARTENSGLKYHLPFPIEKVIKLRVKERYVDRIGSNEEDARSNSSQPESGVLMLTGDENIVNINFEVQWQIADSHKFLFSVRDQRLTVRNAAESAMREIIATTPINDILSEDRITAQSETKQLLQSILDSYDLGVVVKEINMKGTPPNSSITVESLPSANSVVKEQDLKTTLITTTVADAFKDVQAAINNKQEKINIAEGYANQQVPIARGEAQKILQEAEGFANEVIATAQGDSSRFLAVYNEYKKSKDVTKRRMYLETMEKILPSIDKIIVDSNMSEKMVPYLPLNGSSKHK